MMVRAQPPVVYFTPEDLERAWDEWGCNCGPAALAVAIGRTPDAVRNYINHFQERHYTNPTMMVSALRELRIDHEWKRSAENPIEWPRNGLARIQWSGPWTAPGVPIPARYRHSHWVTVATINNDRGIWDVNCPHWISFDQWQRVLVPLILKDNEPKSDGKWWVTDAIEVIHQTGFTKTITESAQRQPHESGQLQEGPPAPAVASSSARGRSSGQSGTGGAIADDHATALEWRQGER
jgi:hypothetical protein